MSLDLLVAKEAIKKSNLNSNDIDELIMGQVLTRAAGQNPARQAAIAAGLPIEKTAYVINQVCGSGLRSVAAGYQSIISNDSNIIIAGGQESMTNAPHAINIRNDGKKLEEKNLIDTMIKDGLWDAFNGYHMGITAENVAINGKLPEKIKMILLYHLKKKLRKHKKKENLKMKLFQ